MFMTKMDNCFSGESNQLKKLTFDDFNQLKKLTCDDLKTHWKF